jgi:hypothetical protein
VTSSTRVPCVGEASPRPLSASPSGPPWTQSRRQSTVSWTRSTEFSIGRKFRNMINPHNFVPNRLYLSNISLRSSDVCKKSCRALSFQKILQIGPKPLQTLQKSPKNSQISQEPLSFVPKPSNHFKNFRICPEPLEKTILPLKASRAIFFDPKLCFYDS